MDLNGIIAYSTLAQLEHRGKAERVRRGCLETPALYSVESLPQKYKVEVYRKNPDLRAQAETKPLLDAIVTDGNAVSWFEQFTLPDGRHLPEYKQLEYSNNAAILNCCKAVYERCQSMRGRAGKSVKKGEFWRKVAAALPRISDKWPNSLHLNASRLQEKFRQYIEGGYETLINGRFMNQHAARIKNDDQTDVLLRICAASAGNDHRLGASEAPPAILSVFLGDELTNILDAIEKGEHGDNKKAEQVQTGVEVLPDFKKDTADRNRTSPFAFTGNKFEFRMVGSSFSVADANIVLNTAVADVLDELSDQLEGQPRDKVVPLATAWMAQTIKTHKRIIYNGNNYSDEWVAEADRRGLYNLRTTADAVPLFVSEKNVELFTRHHIFTKNEIASRCEIMLDNYCKINQIEALTMLDMAKKEIMPAALAYANLILNNLRLKKEIGLTIENTEVFRLNQALTELTEQLSRDIASLEATLRALDKNADSLIRSAYYRDFILPAMERLRITADKLEETVAEEYWPYPTYNELLFHVK